MPKNFSKKVSFILQFSRASNLRWTGQLQEVEEGEVFRFVCVDALIERFAEKGVRLLHRKTKEEICANCSRLGGLPMEGP